MRNCGFGFLDFSFFTTIFVLLSCSVFVKSQWVLDNRCARRRNLLESWESILTTPESEHRGGDYQLTRTKFEHLDLLADDRRNSTEDVENNDVWYRNLRGYRDYFPTSAKKSRNLSQQDSSPFMMRLHWQEGNCWQGTTKREFLKLFAVRRGAERQNCRIFHA